MKSKSSVGNWFVAVVVLAVVVAAGAYLIRKGMQGDTPAATPAVPETTVASASSTPHPAMEHPFVRADATPASASTASLPSLDNSDASTIDALAALAGGDALRSILAHDRIVMRIVATVDALPRQGIGSSILPLRPPQGHLVTRQDNGALMIDDRNAARYAPYMAMLAQVDPQALITWYKRNYPLFEQAYRELGYPRGSFNDRVIVAIDDMLRAPEPQGPIRLTVTGTHDSYADPEWQSLSVGQKLMLRMGTENEATVKAKLRAIRSLLSASEGPR